jgi:hypothetical protein
MSGDSLIRGGEIKLRSRELHREAQRAYRTEVRKASKETWRAFCTSINELPRVARLHRALSRDPKVRLGSLVAPSGGRAQSEGETLDLLLGAHFPGSGAAGEGVPGTFGHTMQLDWQVANRVVTYRRVGWAIDSFDPYKSRCMDGIFPALLQEGRDVLVPYLVRILRACLATGYVPTAWRQVKVVFIPKSGRNTYSG